jgi:23S rRNA pseudouridine2605 synthase
MSSRIQKYLAHLGYASRRTVEDWIKAKRLKVNGRVAVLGDQVSDDDLIVLDDRPLKRSGSVAVPFEVLLYHKPLGQMCSTRDPHFKDYVTDHLPNIALGRWVMVGRLDVNTSGLLLFTTDGSVAHHLMHPRFEVDRIYEVKVFGHFDSAKRDALLRSVHLDDGPACFKGCRVLSSSGRQHLIEVRLQSGRYRLVRRLLGHHGLRVSRLKRLSFGCLSLPKALKSGAWMLLDQQEKERLKQFIASAGAASS